MTRDPNKLTLGGLRRMQPKTGESSDEMVDEDFTRVIHGMRHWAQEKLKGTELTRTVDENGRNMVRYEMKQHPIAAAAEQKSDRGWLTGMAVHGDKLLIADIQSPVLLLEPHTVWTPEDPNFVYCPHCLDVSGGHLPNCPGFAVAVAAPEPAEAYAPLGIMDVVDPGYVMPSIRTEPGTLSNLTLDMINKAFEKIEAHVGEAHLEPCFVRHKRGCTCSACEDARAGRSVEGKDFVVVKTTTPEDDSND